MNNNWKIFEVRYDNTERVEIPEILKSLKNLGVRIVYVARNANVISVKAYKNYSKKIQASDPRINEVN